MKEKIKKWVVNDYFTPNIKFEVILDALLTPYITEIVQEQCGIKGLEFITKEMSIKDDREDNRGKKIDYLLADDSFVYMVELKTTEESIEEEQWKHYITYCYGEGKNFGNVFGEKLIAIGKKQCEGSLSGNLEQDRVGWNERIENIFKEFVKKSEIKNLEDSYEKNKNVKGFYEEKAKEILRKKEWNSTWKYFYTMGQLLEYFKNKKDETLWEKSLKLIYITPNGYSIASENTLQKYKEFYIRPKKELEPNKSVSLEQAASYLKEAHKDDEYVTLLCDIIAEIYEKNEMK